MTYAQSFNLSQPTGLEQANTIDEIIRNVKIALNERFIDVLGVDLSAATDPQRVTKIIIPAGGMNIRNSTDSASLIAFTNGGATLNSPVISNGTVSGTLTGGTVAPSVLSVPSGTAITNASLATPALVDPAIVGGTIAGTTISGTTTNSGTISGGTISGATVNAGTFSGSISSSATISGGTVAPTTLTVPSGTTIPTHTETGTITATGSTRNGGTISGATLNNTTFTGTTSGISANPTVTSVNGSTVTPTYGGSYSTMATLSLNAGTYLVWATAIGRVQGGTLNLCEINIEAYSSTGSIVASNTAKVTNTGSSIIFDLPCTAFGTVTFSSAGSLTLRGSVQGQGATPSLYNGRLTAMLIA